MSPTITVPGFVRQITEYMRSGHFYTETTKTTKLLDRPGVASGNAFSFHFSLFNVTYKTERDYKILRFDFLFMSPIYKGYPFQICSCMATEWMLNKTPAEQRDIFRPNCSTTT